MPGIDFAALRVQVSPGAPGCSGCSVFGRSLVGEIGCAVPVRSVAVPILAPSRRTWSRIGFIAIAAIATAINWNYGRRREA